MMRKNSLIGILIALGLGYGSASFAWSGWLKVERVDIHPTWKLRVLFDKEISAECPGVRLAEWSYQNDEAFMDRITSSMLTARVSDREVVIWVSLLLYATSGLQAEMLLG